jgi:hypothetical protein
MTGRYVVRGPDPLLPVLRQLTSRDRRLLELLYDHKVFTTEQIATALFPNLDTAQHRLVVLYRLGVVDRFRWFRDGGGSYPWRYTVGQLGAEYVAALRGEDPPRRDQITKRNRRLATSPTIEHTLGANGFFTDLLGYARARPGTGLRRWWSADQCNRPGAFGPLLLARVRPDGHGVWVDGDKVLLFFLEHDTGTEFSGGRCPFRSPDLRISAAQRLMGRRYRPRQVWCKHCGGVSPVRVVRVGSTTVHKGRSGDRAHRTGDDSRVADGWAGLRGRGALSRPSGCAATELAMLRGWYPCRDGAWGRRGRGCWDRRPDRLPSGGWAAARGRFGCCAAPLRKTLRCLCCRGGIRA